MDNTETMYDRALPLFGEAGMTKLRSSRVILFGAGGVGGSCAEALVRGGIGSLTIVDGDVYAPSNLNRQRFATSRTLGKNKAEAAAGELSLISPAAELIAVPEYYKPGHTLDLSAYDYIVDAIDDLPAKLALILAAQRAGVRIVCACGAGNKLDPTRLRISDIYSTSVCPLARALRKACRDNNVPALRVVWSDEPPVLSSPVPASSSFVPPAMGLTLAAEVIRTLAFPGNLKPFL